jgi:serine/threonine protein kinase
MAMEDSLIGKKLGDYVIEGLLGRGGMSRVYQGYDENLQRYAAVKVISGDFATTSEEEYTRRFQSEARAIAHLRHPNIVGVYQFGRWEGIYYMAQVFLEGKDLRHLLKDYDQLHKRIPVPDLLRIARDVASALDYAHEQGVIHRDIKPSNIMLEKKTGRAILMDFGLALTVQEGTMGDTFGSAHYIAPEQAMSSARSVPQSDLYALGVVIYEMLAGVVPFDDPSVMSVALKHLNESPPPLRTHVPDISPVVEKVIMRALDKDPNRRYATASAFVDALEAAFAGEDGAADLAVAPKRDSSEPFSTRRLFPAGRPGRQSDPDAPASGIAARFMRRKAIKEEESALAALDENDLQIDDMTLDSILSSYSDPSELGLTGASASRPAPLASAGEAKSASRPARRSRVGLLLALILVAVIAGGAIWLGTQGGGEDDVAGGGPDRDATATGEALAALLTEEATSEAGEESTPALTGETGMTPSATPPPATDEEPATATATTAATATATEPPASTAAQAGSSAISGAADLRMTYGEDEFLLINVSGKTLDVSNLVFEQQASDGRELAFSATLWAQVAVERPSRMGPDGCYQIVTSTATQRTPSTSECPRLLGFFRSNLTRRYFWVGSGPGAAFTVRYADADAPLATCPIDAGECVVALGGAEPEAAVPAAVEPTATLPAPTNTPAPTATGRPSVTPSPPPTATATVPASPTPTLTPTEAPPPSIRLVYDDQSFLMVNVSGGPLDVSGLVFVQDVPDGDEPRSYEASTWRDAQQMQASGCYQLLSAGAAQVTPPDSVCERFLGWYRTSVAERYFWMADSAGAVFTVRAGDDPAPLTECAIDAGECAFYLPPGE